MLRVEKHHLWVRGHTSIAWPSCRHVDTQYFTWTLWNSILECTLKMNPSIYYGISMSYNQKLTVLPSSWILRRLLCCVFICILHTVANLGIKFMIANICVVSGFMFLSPLWVRCIQHNDITLLSRGPYDGGRSEFDPVLWRINKSI